MGKKNDREISPMFDTLAITNGKYKAAGSNMAVPPESSVWDAKDWVDYNEK